MRSYYDHLATTGSTQRVTLIEPRPVLRASAIFPVFHENEISTRLLFMGYWILKRNISELTSIVTLRSEAGQILARKTQLITEAKAYRIEVKDLYPEVPDRFLGSIEIEFFSTKNLFFPYPAVTVNYYGPNFSSVVHTAQRVYNDVEDANKNSAIQVPESGFNMYADDMRTSFFALINGPMQTSAHRLSLDFYNSRGDKEHIDTEAHAFNPYETKVFYPSQMADLESFFQKDPGACKIHFQVAGIFPRLLAGNFISKPKALTVTHTYYDCTNAASTSDYWKASDPDWHQASLMLPVLTDGDLFTTIDFYPIYSPSSFTIDVEIYSMEGELLKQLPHHLKIESPFDRLIQIPLKPLIESLNSTPAGPLGIRIIANSAGNREIPARIKVAFDIGREHVGLPCNICTNLQPYVPAFSQKEKSFKWLPLLADHQGDIAFIMNSSPAKINALPAKLTLAFYHEEDTKVLKRELSLPAHGFYTVQVEKDPELQSFLGKKPGWVTALTSNPYTTTYYFSISSSGIVGGDHGY